MTADVLYILGSDDVDVLKIGITEDYERRFNQIEKASGRKMIPLFVCKVDKDAMPLERFLHETFANHRVRGEWFDYCDSVVSKVSKIMNGLNESGIFSYFFRSQIIDSFDRLKLEQEK